MTGLIAMASVPPWNQDFTNRTRFLHDYAGQKGQTSTTDDPKMLNIESMPSWKRDMLLKKTKSSSDSSSTFIFDSVTLPQNDLLIPDLRSKDSISPTLSHTNYSRNSMSGTAVNDLQVPTGVTERKGSNSQDPVKPDTVDGEHLETVQENPFFKADGKIFWHRDEKRGSGQSSIASENSDTDQEEYHVNSGYVPKLCKRFAFLTAKDERFRERPKRASSLENLLESHAAQKPRARFSSSSLQKEGIESNEERQAKKVVNVESQNHAVRPHYTVKTSYLDTESQRGRSSNTNSSYVSHDRNRPRRDSSSEKQKVHEHHIAPDLKIGREDIIIIETTPPSPKPVEQQQQRHDNLKLDKPWRVKNLKDEPENTDELPKPNTVSAFRSMFETSRSTSQDQASWKRHSASLSPPVLGSTSKSFTFTSTNTSGKVQEDSNKPFAYGRQSSPVTGSQSTQIPTSPLKPEDSVPVKPHAEPKATNVFDSSLVFKAPLNENKERKLSGSRVTATTDQSFASDSHSSGKGIFDDKKQFSAKGLPSQASENSKSSTSSTYFPDRKQIFDSSIIKPIAPSSKPSDPQPSITPKFSQPTKPVNIPRKLEVSSSSQKKGNVDTTSQVKKTVTLVNVPKEPSLPINKPPVKFESSDILVTNIDTVMSSDSSDDSAPENSIPEGNGPQKGIPTYILNRNKKDADKVKSLTSRHEVKKDNIPDTMQNNLLRPSKVKADHLLNGSASSPVPKKRMAPLPPGQGSKSESSNETVLDFTRNGIDEVPRSNIDDLISKRKQGMSSVFDSKTVVPKLDLSILADDETKRNSSPYQEGYIPTKIQPCPFVFEGSGVKLKNNLLQKTKKTKVHIQFNDGATSTYEYPSEESALEEYLQKHPDEEAIIKFEEYNNANIDSSDDSFPDTHYPDPLHSPIDLEHSPLPGEELDELKSNTLMKSSGGLLSYKTKTHFNYEFGMAMEEPETPRQPEPAPQPTSEELLPADDEDLTNFTESQNSDMLF